MTDKRIEDLEAENARLRSELDELKALYNEALAGHDQMLTERDAFAGSAEDLCRSAQAAEAEAARLRSELRRIESRAELVKNMATRGDNPNDTADYAEGLYDMVQDALQQKGPSE